MSTPVNINAEIAKTQFLYARNKDTTPEQEDKAFATLANYRNGAIFAGGFAGESPWERHPNGDELVQVLKGHTLLTIVMDDGPETHEMSAGMLVVVPEGRWHKFNSADGVTLMTVTPQPTEHSAEEVPPV